MAAQAASSGSAPLISAAQVLARTASPRDVFVKHGGRGDGAVSVDGALHAFNELGVAINASEASSLMLKQHAGDRGELHKQTFNFDQFLTQLGVEPRSPRGGTSAAERAAVRAREAQSVASGAAAATSRPSSSAAAIAARIAADRGVQGEGYETALNGPPALRGVSGNCVAPALALRQVRCGAGDGSPLLRRLEPATRSSTPLSPPPPSVRAGQAGGPCELPCEHRRGSAALGGGHAGARGRRFVSV